MTKDATVRVFGRHGDPEAIARAVARELRGAEVKRRGHGYVVTATARRGLLRAGTPDVTIEIDGARFDGRDAERERGAVTDDVVRTMRGPGLGTALSMIPDLRIAVSMVRSARNGPVSPTDHLYTVAVDVAARTGGFVLDLHHGRLLSMTGELWASADGSVSGGRTGAPVDPSAARIGARLVALVGLAARALTEYDGQDVEEARDGIIEWTRSAGATDELEPFEEAILVRLPGGMDETEMAHGTWQIEGAAVLAWALNLVDTLPPHDEAVDPMTVSGLLGFPDAVRTRGVLWSSTRRHQAHVEAAAERQYALHWRLTEFAANGEALDLGALARDEPSGPLRFDQVPLLGGDLALRGRPIVEADADALDVAMAITAERLRAVNWLRRGGLYSAVELTP